MAYRDHRLAVDEDTAQDKAGYSGYSVACEFFQNSGGCGRSMQFLNQMEGEISTVIPYPVPRFQGIGAASRVKFLLVVVKIRNS